MFSAGMFSKSYFAGTFFPPSSGVEIIPTSVSDIRRLLVLRRGR